MADTDLSPMERAVKALAEVCWTEPSDAQVRSVGTAVRGLALLRTSDPDAFAAVLAECGMEGHAFLGERVVELEPTSFELCVTANFVINKGDPLQAIACDLGPHEPLYRVEQQTEADSSPSAGNTPL